MDGGPGSGDEVIYLDASGRKWLIGGPFDDSLTGSEASDAIFGADGNDTIDALGGDDAPAGGAGDDAVDGGSASISCPTTPSPCTTASRHPQSDDDRPSRRDADRRRDRHPRSTSARGGGRVREDGPGPRDRSSSPDPPKHGAALDRLGRRRGRLERGAHVSTSTPPGAARTLTTSPDRMVSFVTTTIGTTVP